MTQIPLDDGEAYAAVNGVTLCFQTFGDTNDPAMLMIMGLGAHMIQWDDGLCEGLAARGFYVVRFDNRDVGKSTMIDFPEGKLTAAYADLTAGRRFAPPYPLEAFAHDAFALMYNLKIDRAHVVGFSMGGMIAQLMALIAPERVASLTLIGTSTGERDLPPAGPEFAAIFAAPPPRNVEEFVAANINAWRLMRPAWIDQGEDARDEVRAERAGRRAPVRPDGGARQWLASASAPGRRAALTRVTAPTLVIHGDSDPLLPLAHGEDLARAIPNAKLMTVARMGHNLPEALWPRFIDAIVETARAG